MRQLGIEHVLKRLKRVDTSFGKAMRLADLCELIQCRIARCDNAHQAKLFEFGEDSMMRGSESANPGNRGAKRA